VAGIAAYRFHVVKTVRVVSKSCFDAAATIADSPISGASENVSANDSLIPQPNEGEGPIKIHYFRM
jgi:hypothetical protein